jgi:hypothetical protein
MSPALPSIFIFCGQNFRSFFHFFLRAGYNAYQIPLYLMAQIILSNVKNNVVPVHATKAYGKVVV